MAGGVYCPLSPRDPEQRLTTLLEETKTRVLLVHSITRQEFGNEILIVDIDMTIKMKTFGDKVKVDLLSSVMFTCESLAYVIFTSGSTGTPKAVGLSSE